MARLRTPPLAAPLEEELIGDSVPGVLRSGSSAESKEVCPYPRPGTELSSWERLTLSDGDDLIRVLRLLSRKFSWSSLVATTKDANLDSMRAEIDFYRTTKFALKPSTFFKRPKELPQVCLSEPFPLSEGEVVDLMFQTNFRPRYHPFAEEFEKYGENQKVHARMWRHPPGRALGTLIAIHGWFMGDQRVSALTLVPGFFFRLGLDVVLYELPYHGRRRPKGGEQEALFPSAHVARTNEGFAQAIYELRSLTAWLKTEKNLPVGAVGMSLGGYTAALWASLDRLAFVIPVVPLVSIGDLVWDLVKGDGKSSPIVSFEDLKGLTLEELRTLYAVHCPLSYRPKVPLNRRLVLAGLGDPIIPASQPQLLWEHWEKPAIQWFEGGHLDQFAEGRALREVHEFLFRCGMAYRDILSITGG